MRLLLPLDLPRSIVPAATSSDALLVRDIGVWALRVLLL